MPRPIPQGPHPPHPWQFVILASLLIVTRTLTSAAECDADRKPYIDKEFVIIKSSPSFKEATESAAKAASALSVGLNLRGLSPNLRSGLTFSRHECTRSGRAYPCYEPRGCWDDTYVSVEWSSAYELFKKGLYVVMIASDEPGSSRTRHMLEAARRVYPDAYAKRAKVYVGCMR
jgi:hypothetical protein